MNLCSSAAGTRNLLFHMSLISWIWFGSTVYNIFSDQLYVLMIKNAKDLKCVHFNCLKVEIFQKLWINARGKPVILALLF